MQAELIAGYIYAQNRIRYKLYFNKTRQSASAPQPNDHIGLFPSITIANLLLLSLTGMLLKIKKPNYLLKRQLGYLLKIRSFPCLACAQVWLYLICFLHRQLMG